MRALWCANKPSLVPTNAPRALGETFGTGFKTLSVLPLVQPRSGNMSSLNSNFSQDRLQFVTPIKCGCGQVGTAIWKKNATASPDGPRPELQEVSSGFYMRMQ